MCVCLQGPCSHAAVVLSSVCWYTCLFPFSKTHTEDIQADGRTVWVTFPRSIRGLRSQDKRLPLALRQRWTQSLLEQVNWYNTQVVILANCSRLSVHQLESEKLLGAQY